MLGHPLTPPSIKGRGRTKKNTIFLTGAFTAEGGGLPLPFGENFNKIIFILVKIKKFGKSAGKFNLLIVTFLA